MSDLKKLTLGILACLVFGIAGFVAGKALRQGPGEGKIDSVSGGPKPGSSLLSPGGRPAEADRPAGGQPITLIGQGAPSIVDGGGDLVLPEKFWDREILDPLSDDFKLTEDAKIAFGLDDGEVLRIEGVLSDFNRKMQALDVEHTEWIETDGGAILRIQAWSDDPEDTVNGLVSALEGEFESSDQARFFLIQSRKAFTAITGNFGTEPRLVNIVANGKAPGYIATFYSGGTVEEIEWEKLKGGWPKNLVLRGTESKMVLFEDVPPFLRHLVESP